jgi:large subunit ribosomal protein L15
MITLHSLRPSQHRHVPKRVGRGNASGKGTTAGRGTKGQRARTGGRNKLTRRSFKRLIERTPKIRGFRSRRIPIAAVRIDELAKRFPDGTTVTLKLMSTHDLIPRRAPIVKVIGQGPMAKKLVVQAHRFSVAAAAALTTAGGTAQVINIPPKSDGRA